MKQGNQFYLEVQIFDNEDTLLDISSVDKVQFTIGNLVKTYTLFEDSKVEYDKSSNAFKIWLTEQETFAFDNLTRIDVRVLFKNKTIMGSVIQTIDVKKSLKEVNLDV